MCVFSFSRWCPFKAECGYFCPRENIAKPYTHLQLHLIDHVVDVGAFLSMGRTSPNHIHICSFTSSTMLLMLVRFCPWGEHRQTIYTFAASPHRPCCRCWCVSVHGENITKPYTHLQLHLIDHVVDVGAFLSMGRTSPNHIHICSFTSSTMLLMLVRFCPWGEHRQTIYTFVASPHRPCC